VGKAGTRIDTGDFVRPAEDGVYVKLRASPGAKSTAVKGLYEESAIKLSVAAPPVEGKANAEVERYLARIFGAPVSGITVVKGASSRDKLVFVSGCGSDEIRTRLNTLIR
jgi:uncharacterized protein (TIGR00251 family)